VAAEFCVDCGRADAPVEDGLCANCFAERHALVAVAEAATVTLCPSCGSRKHGERWDPSNAGRLLGKDDLNPFLRPLDEVGIRRVQWTEVGHDARSRMYEGEATVRFRGAERAVPLKLSVRLIGQTCPNCSRKAGHFYTAHIQLRGPEGRLPPGARRLRARLKGAWDAVLPEARAEWRNALSWAEEKPEGWDFYLTDTTAARNLGRLLKDRLHGTMKESATLWGRKDGQDVYRVTICVRVPSVGTEPDAPMADDA